MALASEMNMTGLDASKPSASIAGRIYFATDTNKIYYDTGSAWTPYVLGGLGNYCLLQEQQANNVAAGASTSGAYATRLLNTKVTDTGSVCTLSSNQFVLTAGVYRIQASAPWYKGDNIKLRLYDVTAASVLLVGQTAFAIAAAGVMGNAFLDGEFTAVASHSLALQGRCTTGQATNGLGAPANFGDIEIYAQVELFS